VFPHLGVPLSQAQIDLFANFLHIHDLWAQGYQKSIIKSLVLKKNYLIFFNLDIFYLEVISLLGVPLSQAQIDRFANFLHIHDLWAQGYSKSIIKSLVLKKKFGD
jgi:hypothetical protein